MKLKIKNKLTLIRTVAALLVLLIVMGVVTYSWTMGIEELSIDSGLKTAPVPSVVNNMITLDGTSQQEIDLSNFDQLSHNGMYFSEVVSDDGINFQIPNGGNTLRDANTNDIGEKFIKFEFDVKVTYKCSLRFAEVPTFSIINSYGGSVYDADTSAFRIMIGDGTTSKLFTTGTASGTLNNLTSFGINKDILSFEENSYHTLKISVWLDGRKTNSNAKLAGNRVKLNLKLKAHSDTKKTIIYAEERNGFDVGYGYYAWVPGHNQNSGGDRMIYDSEYGCYKYEFISDSVGSFRVALGNAAGTATPTMTGEIGSTYLFTANNTLEKLGTNDLIISAKVGTNAGVGTVYVNNEGRTSVKASYNSVTVAAIPADGYSFAGWYEDPNCTKLIIGATQRYTFYATPYYYKVYYAKFEPILTYKLTFKAVTYKNGVGYVNNYTGGSFELNYTSYESETTLDLQVSSSIYAVAKAKSGYEFAGWYTDQACTQLKSNGSISEPPAGDATYYAKFVEKTKTVYCTDSQGWGTMYCHYWDDSTNTETTWPGVLMNYYDTNDINGGQKIYKITIPYNTTGIVFNGGSDSKQTVDITDFDDGTRFYVSTQNGNKWNVAKW